MSKGRRECEMYYSARRAWGETERGEKVENWHKARKPLESRRRGVPRKRGG